MLPGYDVVSHPVIQWYAGKTEHILSPKYNFIEVTLTYLSLTYHTLEITVDERDT